MKGNLANNYHENLNERKPNEKKTVGGEVEHAEIALQIQQKECKNAVITVVVKDR